MNRSESPRTEEPAPSHSRASQWVFAQAMRQLRNGGLTLRYPDGRTRAFGDRSNPDQAFATIVSPKFFGRVVRTGDIGLGESFMAGEWTTHDLPMLLSVLGRNAKQIQWISHGMNVLRKLQYRIDHFQHRNAVPLAPRNVAAHYDLSNDFYRTFLDESLSYSSGIFDSAHQTLAKAQRNKIDRVLDLTGIQPGETLVEIGSGWGALAVQAAHERNCRVVTVTLSQQQLALARERVEQAGVGAQVEVRLMDYRDLDVPADAMVSVEMIEAVGHNFLPAYFEVIARCLKPGGRAVIQAITLPDWHYAVYRRGSDFLRHHIFPGGHLPSIAVLRKVVDTLPELRLDILDGFGSDYARTLALWRDRFLRATPTVRSLGFDETFCRKWEFYLAYCEAGFREGLIDVRHLTLQKA